MVFDLVDFAVIESRDKERGVPRVVERWGEPESSKCVLTTSMVDRRYDPVSVYGGFGLLLLF